jgi:glycosyltransferase involved in cell wall biosynthesis
MPIEISVLIPTKNREKSLKNTLESLVDQDFKNFEVVVVDGYSTDQTRKLVLSYKKSFPIQFGQKKGGLIPQINLAWKMAKGKIVIRTDDDVVMEKGWLSALYSSFCSSEKIGGVTGPTLVPEEHLKSRDLFFFQDKLKSDSIFWRIIGRIYYEYFLEGRGFEVGRFFKSGAFALGSNYSGCLNLKASVEVDYMEACNFALRRDLLKQIGGFDPIFSGIGEYNEPDVAFKLRKLGFIIMFNPKAIVHHCPSIEGFFKDRPSSYPRMINFVVFYFRHIKIDSIDKFFRFSAYLVFLNSYYIFQAICKKQINLLGSIPGTIVGLIRAVFERNSANLLKDQAD